MNPRMPPLPEPYGYFDIRGEAADGFTADQLLSAQRAAWNAAMEAAAEANEQRSKNVQKANTYRGRVNQAALFVADQLELAASAIRSLKEPE